MRGEVEAETVRGIFAALAEKYDILAPHAVVYATSYKEGPHGRA